MNKVILESLLIYLSIRSTICILYFLKVLVVLNGNVYDYL